MCSKDGKVIEIILMHNNNSKDSFIWNVGPCSLRVICLSNSQIQAPSIILTIEFGMSIVQIPNVTTISLEPIATIFFHSFM